MKHHSDPFTNPAQGISYPRHNPYIAQMQNADNLPLYYGDQLKDKPGQWRETLALEPSTPLFLEVGCHKGKTINQMAVDYPEYGFLGIDITFKRVVVSAERALKRNLTHVGIMHCRGEHLREVFTPRELTGVFVFFPDPWEKKTKQRKHRLFNQDFADQLFQVIAPSGFLWVKTDCQDYFEEISQHALKSGFHAADDIPHIEKDYLTTFEEKFRRLRLPTYTQKFIRS